MDARKYSDLMANKLFKKKYFLGVDDRQMMGAECSCAYHPFFGRILTQRVYTCIENLSMVE